MGKFAVVLGSDVRNCRSWRLDPLLFAPSAVSALSDSDGKPGGKGPRTCYGSKDDVIVSWSNYGKAVDIAAPGGKHCCVGSLVRCIVRSGSYVRLQIWYSTELISDLIPYCLITVSLRFVNHSGRLCYLQRYKHGKPACCRSSRRTGEPQPQSQRRQDVPSAEENWQCEL